jgi:hypothetical protein
VNKQLPKATKSWHSYITNYQPSSLLLNFQQTFTSPHIKQQIPMEEPSPQQQTPAKMKRNLLLCVDAFGTLFRPRSPIAEQYGSVARGMGVKISDDEVARGFKSGEFLLLLFVLG